MCILYMADPADAQKWRDGLSTLAPQLEFRQWPDIGNPAEVHYILAWGLFPALWSSLVIFGSSTLRGLELISSIWPVCLLTCRSYGW